MIDEDGFALVVALIALVALTALATGGVWIARSNFQATQTFHTGQRAFYTADAALQDFLGTSGHYPPSSATYDFGDGERATVTATRTMHEPNVYHVQATGVVEVSGDTLATRTVGTLAAVDLGPFPEPNWSMFSPGGVEKEGGSGTISGYDHFDPASTSLCPDDSTEAPRNGIVVSDSGGYTQSGGSLVPEGEPNDTLARDRQQMLDDLNLDWQSVVDHESIEPDVVVDPDNPDAAWPDYDTIGSDEWPVIYAKEANNTLVLDSAYSGQGLLIGRGSIRVDGDFSWRGLVAAGNDLTAGNGVQTIEGATMSGLNLLLGESVNDYDYLNGSKDFRYNSCFVSRARGAASHLAPVPGTWYQGESRG